ncbi:hypothetical protein [Embleya sp. NBC_00896]|uniref:hypothetical protein n=1 Tax=Embleya sp. NBC_00896 TaxID=2975961 RepID=UPI002F919810|nr:hypothetical protein OG928_46040 [Embleya sp. NBC_00896]
MTTPGEKASPSPASPLGGDHPAARIITRHHEAIERDVERALDTNAEPYLAITHVVGRSIVAALAGDPNRLAVEDVADALEAVPAARNWWEHCEAELLRAARTPTADGKPRMTWREIGERLGITEQGAQDLYRRRIGKSSPSKLRSPWPVGPGDAPTAPNHQDTRA